MTIRPTQSVVDQPLSGAVLHLHWSDADGSALIDPQDRDSYVQRVHQAIAACHAQPQLDTCLSQYNDLKNVLANWVHQHRGVLARAFLTIRDGRWLFVVMTRAAAYDSGFEDALTRLDWDVSHSPFFAMLSFSVQSIPPCGWDDCASFLCAPFVIEFVF